MATQKTHLMVPGKWLAACGKGDQDRVFKVLDVTKHRGGKITMATVECDGRPWVVHVEWREAVFVDGPASAAPEMFWHVGGGCVDSMGREIDPCFE